MIQEYSLGSYQEDFNKILSEFESNQILERVWLKDHSLFSQDEEVMLDWVFLPHDLTDSIDKLTILQKKIHDQEFSSIVLLGMGGSSLAPLLFKTILAKKNISFLVLDTVHPDAIMRLSQSIDVNNTLFIVASKSGTTLESHLLYRYFLNVLKKNKGDKCYQNFMAITDEHTPLHKEAITHGFLPGPLGHKQVGGRFSAFSSFGMMPALLMNLDIKIFADHAKKMADNCKPDVRAKNNNGVMLATFFLLCTNLGHDKIIIKLDPKFFSLGLWFEQLIAESLGKRGQGLIPIITTENPHQYTNSATIIITQGDVNSYPTNKNPLAIFQFDDIFSIVGLMYQFQMAVALTGAYLGINAFDQPDVEKSKKHTLHLMDSLNEKNGLDNFLNNEGSANLATMIKNAAHDDYIAILSYLDENQNNIDHVNYLAQKIREKINIPIIIQIGPRYLHSTGQLFKGGKNNGNFLFLTGPYAHDLLTEDNKKISDIHLVQAYGDMSAMRENNRRICHVHLRDIENDIKAVVDMIL